MEMGRSYNYRSGRGVVFSLWRARLPASTCSTLHVCLPFSGGVFSNMSVECLILLLTLYFWKFSWVHFQVGCVGF